MSCTLKIVVARMFTIRLAGAFLLCVCFSRLCVNFLSDACKFYVVGTSFPKYREQRHYRDFFYLRYSTRWGIALIRIYRFGTPSLDSTMAYLSCFYVGWYAIHGEFRDMYTATTGWKQPIATIKTDSRAL